MDAVTDFVIGFRAAVSGQYYYWSGTGWTKRIERAKIYKKYNGANRAITHYCKKSSDSTWLNAMYQTKSEWEAEDPLACSYRSPSSPKG